MKTIFTLLVLLGISAIAFPQVKDGTVTMNKIDRPAVIGEFEYEASIVNAVILEDMKYQGFGKGDSFKGFQKYAGIQFAQLSSEKIDFYFKVDSKSKKEKDKSIAYVVISKGYDNFVTSSSDPAIIEAAKQYLSGLLDKFGQQKIKLAIEDQKVIVDKADKKLNSLVVNAETLKTKLKEVEDSIVKNTQDQETQKSVLEREKQLLESLKLQLIQIPH